MFNYVIKILHNCIEFLNIMLLTEFILVDFLKNWRIKRSLRSKFPKFLLPKIKSGYLLIHCNKI